MTINLGRWPRRGTVRGCRTCRGAGMILRIPSAQMRYPALMVGPAEQAYVLCPSCRGSRGQIQYAHGGEWHPHPLARIVI